LDYHRPDELSPRAGIKIQIIVIQINSDIIETVAQKHKTYDAVWRIWNMTNKKSVFGMLLAGLTLIFCQAHFAYGAEAAQTKKPAAFTVAVTGSGRPMIFIPGLSCGGNVWDGVMTHFKDRYQCHVVTLAGFAGQPAIGEPFLAQVRDELDKYIRDNKLQQPVIIGHSLGGFLAFLLGATKPEDVGPIISVDGVPFLPALNDPNATPQSAKLMAENMRAMYKTQTSAQFAVGNQAYLAMMITDPNEVIRVATLSGKSDPNAVGQAFYEMFTTDLRPTVKAIRTSVLLIGATASIKNPAEKKAAEENYRAEIATVPRHKVVFAPKARHFIQLDEPNFLIQEVETFLKETDAAKDK
jgi:pimeloyl-ACP methyl ester carboxylesterase